MTKGKISRVGGIQPTADDAVEVIFRREHAAEGGGDIEFMPAGVKRRVGEHRDAVEDDPIEQVGAGDIAPATALQRLALLVVEEQGAVFVVIGHRFDRLVGADHLTHSAADAGVGHARLLADPGEVSCNRCPGFCSERRALAPAAACRARRMASFRADRGAVAAEGAAILAMLDDPGEIDAGQAAWGNGYGSC